MLLELFSYVNFINAMAFVYAYIYSALMGQSTVFSDFLHYFDTSIVIIDCYLAGGGGGGGGGDLISIAYCLFFIWTG